MLDNKDLGTVAIKGTITGKHRVGRGKSDVLFVIPTAAAKHRTRHAGIVTLHNYTQAQVPCL